MSSLALLDHRDYWAAGQVSIALGSSDHRRYAFNAHPRGTCCSLLGMLTGTTTKSTIDVFPSEVYQSSLDAAGLHG